MSLNAIKDRRHSVKTDAYRRVLDRFLSGFGFLRRTIRQARTEEERLAAEAEVVAALEALIAGAMSIEDLNPAELTYNDQKAFANVISQLSSYGYYRIAALAELYLEYYNSFQMSMLDLAGQMRRIKQKKAVLDLWEDNEAKWVVAEKFLNLDSIDTNFTSLPVMNVDSQQGILTLPIKNSTKLTVGNINIGSGSNGSPGNSDVLVSSSSNNPQNVIAGNELSFEYERLDDGPCDLRMAFQFAKEEVVNCIKIKPVEGLVAPFEVVGVYFGRSAGSGIRLSQMLPGSIPSDFFSVKGLSDGGYWVVSFVPVPAKSISIHFRQTASKVVQTASAALGVVDRKRFAVSLSEVSFYKNEYMPEGGINSKQLSLPGNLFAATSAAQIYPVRGDFYSSDLRLSTDSGESWSGNMLGGHTELLDGTEDSCLWKLSIKSKELFDLGVLFDDSKVYKVNSISRSVSNRTSPIMFRLTEKPDANRALVIRKLARRTDNVSKSIFVGTGKASESLFPLPFDLDEIGIRPDELKVYVNYREWEEVDDISSLALGYYIFSEDHKSIIFSSDLPDKATVRVALTEERCLFEERQDGYYIKPLHLFDPDSCILTHVPSSFSRKTRILPRGVTRISLSGGIDPSSFHITSTTGLTYTSQASRSALAAATDYYLDAVNGILYLHTAISADIAHCSYRHSSRSSLGTDSYSTIYEDLVPSYIRVNKNSLAVHEVTDTVGGSLAGRVDINSGEFSTRTDHFSASNRAMTLSYDYVIVGSVVAGAGLMGYSGSSMAPIEEDYIDGYTEFLGLVAVEKEETVSISAGAGGVSTFNLAAGGLWYSEFEPSFSDTSIFTTVRPSASAVTLPGHYHIDPTSGEVTVFGDLPAGIEISYYYRDIEYDSSNRFSVDYVNGILYTSEDMVTGQSVSYKASSYKLAYDLCDEVSSAEYDPNLQSVSIGTENFDDTSRIKILWKEKSEESTIDLASYFSPIVYSVNLRFE